MKFLCFSNMNIFFTVVGQELGFINQRVRTDKSMDEMK